MGARSTGATPAVWNTETAAAVARRVRETAGARRFIRPPDTTGYPGLTMRRPRERMAIARHAEDRGTWKCRRAPRTCRTPLRYYGNPTNFVSGCLLQGRCLGQHQVLANRPRRCPDSFRV